VRITAQPGEDIVVIRLANGPALYLHPEHARELMRAQIGAVQPSTRGISEPPIDAEIMVPAQLSWRGLDSTAATRGGVLAGIGEAFIDAMEIVTGLFQDKVADMVTTTATRALDGQVDAGVYRLSPGQLPLLKDSGNKLSKLPPVPDGGPILILAHGTFVETSSSFGKLWSLHPARVRALFQHYGGRVYALDHPTVGASPLANAITLAETLPNGARLHLVTHSRGGLVAEVLARVAGGQGLRPEDLALFLDNAYSQHRADLLKLGKLVKQQSFRVERVVRVACPARGTLLASRRLDTYLSVLKWGLDWTSPAFR
jgi:pimeloyl-ACP methyl ester carboxylesterase